MIGLPLNNCFFWRRQHAPVGKSGVKAPHMGKVMGGVIVYFAVNHTTNYTSVICGKIILKNRAAQLRRAGGLIPPILAKRHLFPSHKFGFRGKEIWLRRRRFRNF